MSLLKVLGLDPLRKAMVLGADAGAGRVGAAGGGDEEGGGPDGGGEDAGSGDKGGKGDKSGANGGGGSDSNGSGSNRTGVASAGDAGDGGGGDDGPPKSLTDKQRIEQLKRWERDKKLTGSSSGLREQLSNNKDDLLQRRARERFDEIALEIHNNAGAKPTARAVPTGRAVVMPRGPKRPLRELLDVYKPTNQERHDFGEWLKKNHGAGDLGDDIPLDSKQKISDDPHQHMYSPDQVERLVQDYEKELSKGRKFGNRAVEATGNGRGKPGKGGKGGGGSGTSGNGSGGEAGGGDDDGAGRDRGGTSQVGADGTGSEKGTGHKDGGDVKSGGDMAQPSGKHGGHDTGGTFPKVAPKVDVSKVEAFARQVDALLKEAKAPNFDAEKLGKQSRKLEIEGEALARELRAIPEFEHLYGSRAKEFFASVRANYGSVRASAAGLIVLALNVSDAYALINEVRSILDSKTLREGLERSFELGRNVVKGQIEFGVLRFVFRSTAVAIGIQVFLGDMDMNLGLTPNGKFDMEIADLVNKVRPDSVKPAFHDDNLTSFQDGDAQKLFMETRAQAIIELKQEIALGLEKFGYDDGLVATQPKTKFEVSQLESQVLGIDGQWFAEQYGRGLTRGSADMMKTIGRVAQTGLKDGKEGKGFRFEALIQWPEITAALNGGSALEAYRSAYAAAYEKARAGFDTRTVTNFKISASGAEATAEKYGYLSLYAQLEYSNGTTGGISEEVEWNVSQPSIATVAYDKGARITRAQLIGAGKVKITGKLVSDGQTFEDAMTVTVNPPKIKIVPTLSGNYAVGLELQLTARTETWPIIPASAIEWSTSPAGIVRIDRDGKLVMLKAGEVVIAVTEKTKGRPARASAKIKVVAK